MKKAKFIELLQKYLNGNATKAERQFLLSYYNLFDAEPNVRDILSDAKREVLKNKIKESIWESINIHNLVSQNIKTRYKRRFIIPAAATVLLICITSILLLLYTNQNQKNNTAQNQKQEHRLIELPDGSTVIVEIGSKINYPISFNNVDKREVYLEGQAFFDVKHDSLKPFIVYTGGLKTTVLGTSFNIKAWPQEKDVLITVTKGKVKVGDSTKTLGTIVQNQQIRFLKEKADVIQKEVNVNTYLNWKEQDIIIDDVTLSEVAKMLENRFNVDITFKEEVVRQERFTFTILKNESLEQILRSICEFNNSHYKYDKDKGLVLIKSIK